MLIWVTLIANQFIFPHLYQTHFIKVKESHVLGEVYLLSTYSWLKAITLYLKYQKLKVHD